ncbi:MAG: Hsp20/alpha crystallin family protein [candidate division Zixibacteria bacterium]|nr:Hsp20/alpha crystallin family protein [candidate division Zixibacteria bacterium]MDH3936344.1 Hsp20/alpha crystallin family protein [candidate division Zixibacteria bacterium]
MTYLVAHNRMAREMDRVFGSLFGSQAHTSTEADEFTPRVNIVETENDVSLTFEVPGLEKGDIKVTVTDGVLTVTGERKSESTEDGQSIVRNEFSFGKFSRSFTLPDNYDAGKVAADYKNGLLEVTLPRKEETKPKEIEVKVG